MALYAIINCPKDHLSPRILVTKRAKVTVRAIKKQEKKFQKKNGIHFSVRIDHVSFRSSATVSI
jgi:hypothetical protein